MKSTFKFLSLLLILSITTTSCVSNYVASNNSYKYPSTNELLLAHNTKGPNANAVSEKKILEEKKSLPKSEIVLENVFNATSEKSFSKEAYNLISEAKTYLGTPYLYGGTTRNGIDCSSFVQHVFNAFEISLPRTSAVQSQGGSYVAKEDLKKGDLIFFAHTPKSRVSHVAIVESVTPEGEIFFIHASSSKGVTITSLNMNYWSKRYRTGKRILSSNFDESNTIHNIENDEANLVRYDF